MSAGSGQSGAQGSGSARMRGVELSDAGLQGASAAVPGAGDALNAGYGYVEVRCLGCATHQTVALV